MIYLSAAQVLFIHARLIAETGGTPGISDLGLLSAAVARPRATFAGQELYTTPFTKAAALIDSVVKNHPFVDGNARVAIGAATILLLRNGQLLTVSNPQLEEFTRQIIRHQLTLSEIATWLEENSKASDD